MSSSFSLNIASKTQNKKLDLQQTLRNTEANPFSENYYQSIQRKFFQEF